PLKGGLFGLAYGFPRAPPPERFGLREGCPALSRRQVGDRLKPLDCVRVRFAGAVREPIGQAAEALHLRDGAGLLPVPGGHQRSDGPHGGAIIQRQGFGRGLGSLSSCSHGSSPLLFFCQDNRPARASSSFLRASCTTCLIASRTVPGSR